MGLVIVLHFPFFPTDKETKFWVSYRGPLERGAPQKENGASFAVERVTI